MEPILKGKVLICSYADNRFDGAMDDAEKACGVSGDSSVTIVCFPAGSRWMKQTRRHNHRRPETDDRQETDANSLFQEFIKGW